MNALPDDARLPADAPPPKRRRAPILRLLFGLGGTVVLLLMLGAIALESARTIWSARGPLGEPAQIVIPRGGTQAIAAVLAEGGVIRDPRLFALAAWMSSGQGALMAAEFVFPAGSSLAEVLAILRQGRPVQRRFTIAEGLTARQIATLLERAEGLAGDVPAIAEGAVLPETYVFAWGDSRAALVRRAEAAMARVLAEAWAERTPNLPFAAPREALILASIVERETGRAEERARVAGVFVNRLRRGMMLQSDPTVVYAASDGGPFERAITRADLDRNHPFNTYRIRGLPPGPIASPGRDALVATLRPEAHDFLFFVADGTGGHAFARTLDEHNRNVARWREVERQRRDDGNARPSMR